MGKALPFPMHKHPPVKSNAMGDLKATASKATAAVGEDQGEAGEEVTGEDDPESTGERKGRPPRGRR